MIPAVFDIPEPFFVPQCPNTVGKNASVVEPTPPGNRTLNLKQYSTIYTKGVESVFFKNRLHLTKYVAAEAASRMTASQG